MVGNKRSYILLLACLATDLPAPEKVKWMQVCKCRPADVYGRTGLVWCLQQACGVTPGRPLLLTNTAFIQLYALKVGPMGVLPTPDIRTGQDSAVS